jgi:gliding motility-associated-like protein
MDITFPLNWLLCLKKRFILVPFLFIGLLQQTIETFGQASPLPNPTYESPDQRSIVVTFNQAITGLATSSDWSVTLGGTPAGPLLATRTSATTVRVIFTPSTVNGVGVNYILPGQLVRISFTNISGSLTTVAGGAPVNGTGGAINAVNNYIPGCGDIDFLSKGFYSTNDVCAPVDMNFLRWTYEVSLVYRNSSAYAGNLFFGSVAWGDGFTSNTNSAPSDNLGGATPTFASLGVKLTTQPVAYATIRPTHTYPTTYSLPAPTSCEFLANLTPFFSGLGSCGSKIDQQLFPSYDTDNKNTGTLNLPELVPNSHRVCLGTNVGMIFNDATALNCRVAVEANVANELTRNIRIIYGSQNYAGGNIPNVSVTLPASLGGATIPITNASGALIAPNYFPTSGSADFNGVINLPASVTAPSGTAFMGTIFTTSPAGQVLGQRLYVKLEYWNVCNQYDGISVTGNQEFIENYVEIVTKPVPLTTTGSAICFNTATPVNFTAISSVGGRTAVNWYRNFASVATATRMTNSNGTNSLNFSSNDYSIANSAIGAPFTTNNVNGRYYSVWATQVTGATNSCESDPVEIVIIQQPQINNTTDAPSIPVGSANVCNGGPPETYTTGSPTAKSIAATTSTNNGLINLPTENLWSQSFGAGVTLSPVSGIGNSNDITFNIIPPPSPSTTNTINVRRRYVTSTSIPVISPVPAPFTLPTYNISPQTCQNNNVTLNVTVFGQSAGGTVSANQTICNGSAFSNLTLTGQRGTVLRWERTFNAGAPAIIAGTVGLTSFSETPPNGPGTYTYYAVVRNGAAGPCGPVNSVAATIVVNPIPPQPSISQTGASNGLTICQNGILQTVLQSSDVGGLAASYQWYRNAVSIVGATSSTIILNTVAQSGNYTVQVIGAAPSNCPSPISNPVTVTINPLPTAPNPTGGGAVCSGFPAPDIIWTGLTGTAPFQITYEIVKNPGAVTSTLGPIVEPTTTFAIVAPNPVGIAGDTFDYKITSLVDANGCAASAASLAALSSRQVSIGGTAPAFDTPPSLTPISTCIGVPASSTTDPQLNFSLDGPSTVGGNYTLTYRIDGGANLTKTFTVNLANGDLVGAITFNEAALNNTAPSPHVIRVVSILTPSGCITTFNIDLNFTVNPLPANPTGAVNGIVCSSPVGPGATISVNDPGLGFNVDWYTTSARTTLATGTTSGVRGENFQPTSNLTATYHASIRNTVTGCVSASTLAVTNTLDTTPSPAAGGSNQTICGTTATMAATPANNGGSGVWTKVGALPVGGTITTPSSATTTITGLVQNPPGGAPNVYTFRWTVSSALFPAAGSCPQTTYDVTITVNSLPTLTDPAPQLCETVFGGNQTTGVDLTSFNAAVTSHPSGIASVTWYTTAARTPIVQIATPTSVTVVGTTRQFFWRSIDNNGCSNIGQITFTINGRPGAATQTRQYCEDVIGGGIATGINLNTEFNNAVTGGALNRSVAWFTDAALTVPVAAPTSFGFGPAPITLLAQVTNTLTSCTNSTPVNLSIKPKPILNPILGNTSVCTGTSIFLYQLDPTFNPGSTFTWSIVGTPAAAVQIFGGGGTNSANFFALLQFPSATGSVAIQVTETLNGCVGTPSTMTVNVNSAPAPNTITGPLQVCANQTGVNYAVASPNGTSTYTWNVTGATVASAAGDNINVDFSTISPVVVRVAETAISGCVGADATLNVTVNPRPVMTSPTTITSCSGTIPVSNFTASLPSSFAWTVPPGGITGAITGTTAGSSGTGNLSQILVNASGAVGSVSYNVTPTASAAPGCQGSPQTVTVTVNPEPVLVSAQTKTICGGSPVNYQVLLSPLNLPAGTVFNWPVPIMSDASVQGSAGANVSAADPLHLLDIFNNNTSSPITATYTITPSTGTCVGVARTVVITVNPSPRVSTTLNATKCSIENMGLTLSTQLGSVAANNYNIVSRSISAGLTPAGSNAIVPANGVAANYLANDNFKNLSTLPLQVTYNVEAVSATGCLSAIQPIVITINPEPALSNTLDATVCSGQNIGLTLATTVSSTPAGSFNIVGLTITPGLIPGGTNAVVTANGVASGYLSNDRYTNTGLTSLTAVYQVIPISASGCEGDPPKSITITILPEPVISASLSNSVCSRAPIALTLNTNGSSVAAVSYNITAISVDAGLIPGGSNVALANGVPPSYLSNDTYTNTGSSALTVRYTVAGTSAAGCLGASRIITMTINSEPVMAAILDLTSCSDASSGLILNTNGTSVGAANYNITARSISGGLTPNVGNAAVPSVGVAANYLANDIFTNTGSSSLTVTYTVVPVSGSGCLGASKIITLTINPEPVVSSTLDGAECSNVAIGLVLNTNGSSVAATNYNITARTVAVGLVANAGNVSVPASSVAANYLAGDIFSNTGGTSLNVTYTVVPVSAAGCLGDPRVITLTVNPEPVIANGLDVTICSGAATGITLNTNGTSVSASNYNITSRTIPGGIIANGANATVPASSVVANYLINDRFINTTTTPLVVSYTVVGISAAGCPSPSKIITATINPEPVMANGLDATICSDVNTGLTLNTSGSSVGAATYNITSRTVAGGLTLGVSNASVPATGVAAGYLINDVFTNLGTIALNVTYTVVPVSAAGCVGAAKLITLTINPEPVVSTLLNATVCSDIATGLTLATNGTSVAAATYNITSRIVAGGLLANGANAVVPANGVVANYLIGDLFTNTGNTALTVSYTIVPVSAGLCLGNPQVITITINPEPVLSTTLNATLCSGVNTGLVLNTNGTSVAAANYNITARSIAPGLTASGGNAVVPATGVATGYLTNDRFTNATSAALIVAYTIVPVAAGGCLGDPVIVSITINPEPVVSPTLNRTVCSDLATGLVLNTNGTSVAASNYNINSVTIAGGLVAAGTNAVIPATGVNANFVANDRFTNTGSSALTVVYRVVPISAASCLGAALDVTVTINPEPVVSTTLDASACSGLVTGLALNTNGSSVAAANYNITARTIAGGLVAGGGNVAVPASGVATGYLSGDRFTNTGATSLAVTYTVVPVSAAGCIGKSRVVTITINPEPVVSTTLNSSVCSDLVTGLTLATNGSSVAAANYNITTRTIAVGLSPAGTNAVVPASSVAANYLANDRFTNTGTTPLTVTYTVVPVSGVPCTGQPQVITITINPEPVVANGLDKTVCSDLPIALTLNTVGTSVAAGSYNIASRVLAGGLTGAGANAAVPASGVAANYLINDSFNNNGAVPLTVTYTVVPVSGAGCLGDPKVIVITINPEPVVSSTLDASTCSGLATGLNLATNGTSVSAQNYNITARTIAGGLTASGSNVAVPAASVAANYLANDVFTNTGATSLNVTYTVVPVSSNGCLGDPRLITITIDPQPVVSSTLNKSSCSDIAIALVLNTNGTSVAAATYDVTSRVIAGGLTAAGSNAVVPSNGVVANYLATDQFTNTGKTNLTVVYTVVPISAGGCRGAAQAITVTINPEPVLATNLNRTVCSDLVGGITLNTTPTSALAANYNITAVSIQAGLTTVSAAAIPASGVAANYLATDRYTNLTAAPLEVSYTVVPVSAGGCLGDPLIVKQIVNPEPVLGSLNTSACSDQTISLTLNTNGTSIVASTYNVTTRTIAGGLTAVAGNAVVPAAGVSSSYLLNDKFTNVGNTTLNVTYTVVPVSTGGCLGDPVIVTVAITPKPVVSALLNRTVCSGSASGITLNTNGTSVAAATYNVTSIVISGGLVADPANVPIANNVAASYIFNDKFINRGNASLTIQYTIVPVAASGCLGDPLIVVLTINPEPVIDPALALKTICSGATTSVTLNTNGTSVAAASYDISVLSQDVGLTGTPTIGTSFAANAIFGDTYTNVTGIPLKVVYSVVPKSAVPCLGATFTITVTVNPEPVVSPTLDNTVCSDDISNIVLGTNGTSATAASYEIMSLVVPGSITAGVGNTLVGSTGSINLIRNDKFTNTTNATAIVVYGIRGISNSGCAGQVQLINLSINPKPVLDPALNPTPVCSGLISNVTLGVAPGSVAAVTYNINSITFTGLTAGSGNTGIGTGKLANAIFNDLYINTSAGPLQAIYNVVPVSAAGCLGAVGTVTLTINPSPALSPGLGKTVCSTDVSGITLISLGSSIAAANYNIISVAIDPSLTQTAGNTGARTAVGANELVNDRFQNLTNTVRTVTYKIEPVSAAGCKGPQVDVVLSVEPSITMITPPNASLCSDTPNTPSQTNIVLDSNTTPSSGGVTFDYTAVSTPPGAVFGFFPAQANLPRLYVITDKLVNNTNAAATVTYTITPKAVGAKGGVGCSATVPTVVTITVDPKPRLSITPATEVVCEGVATSMTLSSTTVPSAGTIQFTKIGAVPSGGMTLLSAPKAVYLSGEQIGDVWDNPTVNVQTVAYTFRAEVVGGLGCISEDITAVLTVNPSPTIVASAQLPICSSDFVNITLAPDVTGAIATYTASDPSGKITGATGGAGNLIFQTLFYNSTTPTVANSDGPVTVTYTVTPKASGCTGTPVAIPVVVNPKPKILPLPNTITVCHGNNLTIPLASNVTGANYTWTVDNPSGLPGVIQQTVPGVAGINQVLTNTTGVQASLTYTIKAFGPGVNPNDCEGDQKIVIVTVAPELSASFQNLPSSICKGASEFLIIQLNGQAPFSFVYNQNDGFTNTDIPVTGAGNFKVIQVNPTTTTTYEIKSMKDAFNCPVTLVGQTVTITVGDPDPNFSIVAPTAACGPAQFRFQYNQKAGTQYTWQWQDGSADSTYLAIVDVPNQIIRHTFTNLSPSRDQDYSVTLRVELPAPFPGCFKFTSRKVTVFAAIVPNVFPDKTELCSGETIRVTNQSLGATSHTWFWRNTGSLVMNDVRTTSSVAYTLTNTGALNPQPIQIVYQARSANCAAPDVVVDINVYKGVTSNFSEGVVPLFNSGSATVNYTNTSVPFDIAQFRYDWVFGLAGDAAPNTLTQTTVGSIPVVYTSPGTKTVILSVTNIPAETAGISCKSDFSKNITIILPQLAASFDIDPTELCFPGSIKLKNVVGTGFVHEWRVLNKKTGASFTSNVADPVEFKITSPGEYTVSYRTSIPSTSQFANAPLKDVVIYDLPLATFDLRPDIVYVPDTEMSTFNFSNGANQYLWDFGDGGTSDLFEPKYTYAIEGKYEVLLIAKFDHGNGVVCADTLKRTIIAKQGGQAKIPNVFTPNPSGPSSNGAGANGTFNDVFLPIVKGIANDSDAYNLQIYDRWGNLIFESTSSVVGWDGYNKDGKLMPAGVYVYKLTVRFSDSQRSTRVGDITMIR